MKISHDTLLSLTQVSKKYEDATARLEKVLSSLAHYQQEFEELTDAKDQFNRFGSMRTDVASSKGCTYFGHFGSIEESRLAIATSNVRCSYTIKMRAMREFLLVKQEFTTLLKKLKES